MNDVAVELVGGPWDSRTGRVQLVNDQPPTRLMFNLDDKEAQSTLLVPGQTNVGSELVAYYDLIDEKPRKIILIEEVDGHARARSERGARYRYDKQSPCERLFEQARHDVLLTAEARDQVMATRRLLLDQRAREKESAHEHRT